MTVIVTISGRYTYYPIGAIGVTFYFISLCGYLSTPRGVTLPIYFRGCTCHPNLEVCNPNA